MIYQNIELHGISEVTPDARGGVRLCRIPAAVTPALCPLGRDVAENVVGVELRFVPLEEEVKITLSTAYPGALNNAVLYYGSIQSGGQTLEVRINNTPQTFTFHPSVRLDELRSIATAKHHPFSPRVLRVLFNTSPVVLHSIEGAVRPPLPDETPVKKCLFYGSSITHGSLACAPNMFWTRRTAEALGLDHENYGLAGSCRMENEMADWFASRDDWDCMVLEMGVNIQGIYGADTYRERVRYMLKTLHAAHPEKYLFCIDLFYCCNDLRGEPLPPELRRILAEEVARLHSDCVVHLPGLQLMGDVEGLSEDLIHPSIDGVNTITRNLTAALQPFFSK